MIDEIGKMECASERFRRALEDVLDAPVNVLVTMGMGRLPFFEAVRKHPYAEIITLTEHNRNVLVAELCGRLERRR